MLFRRKNTSLEYEPVKAPEPKVTPTTRETYKYDMGEFKERLGLEDVLEDVLTVHITWDKMIEVEMYARLRIVRAYR